jgi:hypothetical protein
MKNIKLDAKRLHLKKMKIADLTEQEANSIQGGTAPSTTMQCTLVSKNSWCNCIPPDPGPSTVFDCPTGSLFWECRP